MAPSRQGNVLIWGVEAIEPNTIAQAKRTADLPFVAKPLALMPDAHVGIGATVGSVAFMQGALVPAAVGVDELVGALGEVGEVGVGELDEVLLHESFGVIYVALGECVADSSPDLAEQCRHRARRRASERLQGCRAGDGSPS